MSGTYINYSGAGLGGGGGGGGVTGVGPLDSQPASPDGLVVLGSAIIAQSATAVNPGLVSSAAQTFAGIKTFNSSPIAPDPTTATQVATKNYVDTQLSAFQPIEDVRAASASVDYPGLMVGNVLTITATGAISIDSVTPSANDRILLKDQSTTSQNGVYIVTTVGSIGVAPVLTRAGDFNTPAEVNAGNLIPVLNGTINQRTSWLQTATVVTINTDPLIFLQYSANPANVPIAVGLLNSAAASSNGAVIGSSSLYLQSASTTNPGLISSAAQTFAGTKTFNQPIVYIANGSASFINGQIYYDNSSLTPTFNNSIASISLQIGQENWVKVSNVSGATIGNGRAVYITGAVANGDAPTIGLAIATTTSTSALLGVATHDIANNSFGFVTQSGKVHGIDTSAYAPGQRVWLSASSAGFFQVTDPLPPNYSIFVGYTLDVGSTTGSLFLSGIRTGTQVPFVNPMTTSGDMIVGSGSGIARRLAIGATNQFVGVTGGLPVWQNIDVTAQTVGSVSLTNKVVGVLPLANGGSIATGSNTGDVSFGTVGNTANAQGASVAAGQVITLQPASATFPGIVSSADQIFSGVKTMTQGNIIAGTDGIYAIGSASNASGSRYNAIYVKNRIVAGIFPASAGSQFCLLSTNEGPNNNPYLYLYTGSGNGYAMGNDGVFMYILNVGAGVQQFGSGALTFKFVDTNTGLPYITGSTTALRLNKIPLQLVGSTSFNAVSLKADDNTGSYNFVMPTSAGTASFILSSLNGVGSTSWVSPTSAAPLNVTSKIANYNSATSDGLILCSSTAFTITLFNAVGNSGVTQRIKKTDAVVSNIVTVVGTASQTIDGYASRTLNTFNESYLFVSDGTNFQILDHDIDSTWNTFTPVISGVGSTTSVNYRWRRVGQSMEMLGSHVNGTITTVPLFNIGVPFGLTIDSTGLSTASPGGAMVGVYQCTGAANALANLVVALGSTTAAIYGANVTSGTTQLTPAGAGTAGNVSAQLASFSLSVPINGWCG